MGGVDRTTVVSAEACASEDPLGMADRMRDTLEELSRMEGQKFYFVGTAGMALRAGTKARKAQGAIRVVQDSLSFAPARERS